VDAPCLDVPKYAMTYYQPDGTIAPELSASKAKALRCANPGSYLFWDSVHPSDRTYARFALLVRPAMQQALRLCA